MANIFIFHGREGHPEANWFPWLRDELEGEGHSVFIPQFPGGEEQTLDGWIDVFKKYEEYLTDDTVFVGHSLGAVFVLSLLEQYKALSAFIVSGFIGKIGKSYDGTMKTFAQRDFDWEAIQQNCKSIHIIHGYGDSVVETKKAEELRRMTRGELKMIEDGGHLDEAAGYYQFDVLLDLMQPYLGK